MTIQKDKVMHAVTGAGLAFVVSLVTNPWVGVGVTMAVGAIKEYVKDAGYLLKVWPSGPSWLVGLGTVDWKDMAATSGGGYIGALLALLVL